MKRWDGSTGTQTERPDVDAFIEEVLAVCKKHRMSIGHEDGHGSFIVYEGADKAEANADWLRGASVSP